MTPQSYITDKECPRSRFVIVQREEANGIRFKKIKISCGTWSCPVCSEKLRKVLYKKISKSCTKKDFHFLTLTLRLNEKNLAENWKILAKSWDILLKRLRRKFGKVRYFRTVELTKKGMPHIHALIDCYLPQKELQDIWNEITGDSFIARFEKVRYSCAGYVLKYLSKSQNDIIEIREGTGKKTKLYVFSRGLYPVDTYSSDWKLYYFCRIGESAESVFEELKNKYTWNKYGCTKPPDVKTDPAGFFTEMYFSLYHLIVHQIFPDYDPCPVGKSPIPKKTVRIFQPTFSFTY